MAEVLIIPKWKNKKVMKIITGFSFMNTKKPSNQISCWITYTNEEVHEILKIRI